MKTLVKEFQRLVVEQTEQEGFTILNGSGWRNLGAGAFLASTYFDLAGMSQQEKTLFFSGATVQDVSGPLISPATAGDLIRVADIMTTTPITDQEAVLYITDGNFQNANQTLSFQQTIYGRVRVFNMDLDNLAGGYAILLHDDQTGSLSPTASDRVYCYRAVIIIGGNARYDVLASRYILRAEAKEEPEYEYLMRLKRSYELQNEPDRD